MFLVLVEVSYVHVAIGIDLIPKSVLLVVLELTLVDLAILIYGNPCIRLRTYPHRVSSAI